MYSLFSCFSADSPFFLLGVNALTFSASCWSASSGSSTSSSSWFGSWSGASGSYWSSSWPTSSSSYSEKSLSLSESYSSAIRAYSLVGHSLKETHPSSITLTIVESLSIFWCKIGLCESITTEIIPAALNQNLSKSSYPPQFKKMTALTYRGENN